MTTQLEEREALIHDLATRVEALEHNAPTDSLALGVMNGSLDYTIAGSRSHSPSAPSPVGGRANGPSSPGWIA
ncbi:MAG: hypothetical protein A2Z12_08810 [Actinobacteria bacterium RBG_16_68_21]|nr:MAG: hypothetical protein A2Z12_08810 [Actinobacteria bacterium RBG_16_68_21]